MSEIDSREGLAGVYLGRRDTGLILRPPHLDDLDTNYIRMRLELRAAGLAADGMLDLAGWGGWVVGFIAYFDDLAANWKGWKSAKVWSDDSGAVDFSATHNGMSEIHLVVKLRPFYGNDDGGTWELRVVVPIEAGRMPDIATAARAMLHRAGLGFE
jgi:hypothetical protein